MKYKALILDLDGTTIPNSKKGMPSDKVRISIAQACKKVHVGIATSRCYTITHHIIDHLSLSGPSILSGGGKVMMFPEKEIVFQRPIANKDVKAVCSVLGKFDKRFYICDDDIDMQYKESYIPNKVYQIFKTRVSPSEADEIIKKLNNISTIATHRIPDWTPGKFSITINHAEATKQHGIFEVAKILGIETHEIIGVGDGYNDFPLLMACGLKVAMGNAVDDLKAIADYVAPSVDEDGVADVIEKYIL